MKNKRAFFSLYHLHVKTPSRKGYIFMDKDKHPIKRQDKSIHKMDRLRKERLSLTGISLKTEQLNSQKLQDGSLGISL